MKKQSRCLEAKQLLRIAKKVIFLEAKSKIDLTYFQTFQYQSELQSVPGSIVKLKLCSLESVSISQTLVMVNVYLK